MKVSYNWLKEYIEGDLPQVSQVVEVLTMHSFEVEGVEEKDEDKILDIKILPNRSHDCLSHYGIASEVASVMDLTRKPLLEKPSVSKSQKISRLDLDTKLCGRAMMIYIKDLQIGESPEWLKEKLQALGQKPINSIVDITNYLTLAFGQPMHAFDAGKLSQNRKGNFDMSVRQAKNGEKIILLNGKEITLENTMMVITDGKNPLDVAGVMGGKETGVSLETKEIILSLSSFDPVSIRKTAKSVGVRTDASHRFENGISPSLIDRVLPYALKMITEVSGGVVEGGVDTYPKQQKPTEILVATEKIGSVLGITIDKEKAISLLAKQNIASEVKGDTIKVTAPLERLDLEIQEDIAEEVGRLYGYNNILPKSLEGESISKVNPEAYVTNLLRRVLIGLGFSEVYTYAFTGSGEVEVENPLAGDKKFLRRDLVSGLEASLEHNFKYMDLLGITEVKLFEIGNIFTSKEEALHLSLGVKFPKSKKISPDEEIAKTIQAVEKELGISIGNVSVMSGVAEIDVARILKEISIPEKYPEGFWKTEDKNISYKSISPYPFAVRDVAVFVPNEVGVGKVEELIRQHTDSNVIRLSLFDKFTKGDKTSYAFRLIFQSTEKTLTDEEINAVMNPIYETLKAQEGFEIR